MLDLQIFTYHFKGPDEGQRVRVKLGQGQVQPAKYSDGEIAKGQAKLQVFEGKL
ncbi:hypothetical protein A2U01_0061213, partial [Trifolium medium]|nr:hypothetical protein [Trifolium medium]